jgi:hypothetical protein
MVDFCAEKIFKCVCSMSRTHPTAEGERGLNRENFSVVESIYKMPNGNQMAAIAQFHDYRSD